MAFLLYSTDDGRVPPIEYLPCSAITPKVGMALVVSAGNLAVARSVNAPKYISLFGAASTLNGGTIIPVMRVGSDMILETTLSAAGTSLNIGDKVTLHATNGLQVTATTQDSSNNYIGIAEIVAFPDGTKTSGSRVRVRF